MCITDRDTCVLLLCFRLAYADYILAKLVEDSKVPSKINLLYDIGCKLVSHWKVLLLYLCHNPWIFHVYNIFVPTEVP